MKRGEQGFALVETIIAAAIIAAMLGVTYQTIIQAGTATAATQSRREAMLVARSILSQVGETIPLVPGAVSGAGNGWRWRVAITMQPVQARDAGAPLDHVVVTVADESQTLARLETLRLAR